MKEGAPEREPKTRQSPVSLGGGARLFLHLTTVLISAFLASLFPTSGLAGQGEAQWNTPRVLEMIQQARDVRQQVVRDTTLRSYSSNARGYVYFFLDREDTGERVLVKTDQIALEVYWRAPNLTRQRIVGLRDEKSLPTNIHYHLDHLVVVQDEFGDRIRIGDGDEIESVMHPAAPGSEDFYDFSLADSVTLTLQNALDTIRVFEVQVRPKNLDAPGFVGSVFLDRESSAIVRMSFTFTPSSYVDPYLDHISISLENGLWMGRYWLPFRQQLEIRREVPYLDIPAGSVIRGWFEIRDYEINPPLPQALFMGTRITALPDSLRRAFPFEDSLHAQLDEEGFEGLRAPPDMAEIRAMAASIAKERYLSGLGPLRLFLPSPTASSALRYNRVEGLFLGAGASYRALPQLGISAYAGFAFGREKPLLQVRATGGERHPGSGVEAFLNRPLHFGPVQTISGVTNSLSTAVLHQDYTDLFFARGGRAYHNWSSGAGHDVTLEARVETHRSGRDVVSEDPEDTQFRPVLPIEAGRWSSLGARAVLPGPWPGLRLSTHAVVGRFETAGFGQLSAGVVYQRSWLTSGVDLETRLEGGTLMGTPPHQALYLMGGRGTVPGYAYRSRVGDSYWLFRTEGTVDVLPPFLKLRGFGAAGGADFDGEALPAPWPQRLDSSPLISLGLGLGLGWDVLRLDAARGLTSGGEWEFILSVNRDFWAWL